MTNNIGRIAGGGSGSINFYGNPPKNHSNEVNPEDIQSTVTPEVTEVDPEEVMAFMARNNNFAPIISKNSTEVDLNNIDAETKERVAECMPVFLEIYQIVSDEFGERLAPSVMELVMNKLFNLPA